MKTKKEKNIVAQKQTWNSADLPPALILGLYLINGLVPELGAVKVSGTQWLYLSLLNIGGIIYLLRTNCYGEARELVGSIFSRLYGAFFLVVGLSIFFAFNKVESIVSYGEFFTTITAYVIVAILILNRLFLFRMIAWVLTVILLIESIKTLSAFSNGLGEMEFDKLILSLRGNVGNKNILAATLVIKLPFAIWIMRTSNLASKIIVVLTLALAGVSIFIINSRSAYLGLFGIIVLYIIYEVLDKAKQKDALQEVLKKAGWVVLPVALAFFISQQVLKNAIESQGTAGYGTVTERLSSISLSEEGSTARTFLWKNAIDYIRKHPITGSGYGNWKIEAFPYDHYFYDDFIISYNVHNDFLEYTAEAGIGAGLLYFSLYVCLGLYVIRTWLTTRKEEHKQYASFALMALGAYFVDAVLNFPHEIPSMQFMFVLSAAIIVNTYLTSRTKKTPGSPKESPVFRPLLAGWLIISIATAWLALKSYRSLVIQYRMDNDLAKEKPEIKADELLKDLPSIPNLSARALPLDEFKAVYLTNEKRYAEALSYLDKVPKSNPYIAVDDLLRARIYGENQKHDSAYKYAVKGFFAAPRGRTALEILFAACYNTKDSVMLVKAFREYIKYRPEPWAWNQYLRYLEGLTASRARLAAVADSALALYPNDNELQQRKANYAGGIINPGNTNAQVNTISSASADSLARNTGVQTVTAADTAYINKSNEIFQKAQEAYARADYNTSIKYMLEFSERNKGDYRPLENVGFAYYAMSDFKNAILYFNKVIALNTSMDGKTEFYLGNSYLFSGDPKMACKYFAVSMRKKYFEAKGTYDASCKDLPQ